jgi:hypothetical protein
MLAMDLESSIKQSGVLCDILKIELSNMNVVKVDGRFHFYIEFPESKVGVNIYKESVRIFGLKISTCVVKISDHDESDDESSDEDAGYSSDFTGFIPEKPKVSESIQYKIELIDSNREVQYVDKIGYFGSKSFSNINELIGEINRGSSFS